MALTSAPVLNACDTPTTTFDEFRDILAGLRLEPVRIEIDCDRHRVTVDHRELTLSRKEYALLTYLAQRADDSVTREELLESVWGTRNLGEETRTIDAHIRRLRAKLPCEDLISTVRGVGYRFNSTPLVRVHASRVHALVA